MGQCAVEIPAQQCAVEIPAQQCWLLGTLATQKSNGCGSIWGSIKLFNSQIDRPDLLLLLFAIFSCVNPECE
jgi:hypothetical protein